MINFKFPDVGEGIHEGQILKWNYDVGDEVEEGETLCVVETDKVNAEMPAPEDGVLKKKGAEVGETIHVGDILAVIDDGEGGEAEEPENTSEEETDDEDEDENVPEEKKSDENASVVGSIESSDEVLPASDEHKSSKSEKKSTGKTLATPVARKLAKDLGVDIDTLVALCFDSADQPTALRFDGTGSSSGFFDGSAVADGEPNGPADSVQP